LAKNDDTISKLKIKINKPVNLSELIRKNIEKYKIIDGTHDGKSRSQSGISPEKVYNLPKSFDYRP
jgi:hypothetical protein